MFRKGPKKPDLKTTAAIGDIVSDKELRSFWISWAGKVITWGSGDKLGENTIGSYTDEAILPIKFMSVASYTHNTAHWVIPDEYYK